MGMTDRQFDTFLMMLLDRLKKALELSPDNEELQGFIAELEAQLRRP
jgi:hypothetical protein